MKTYEKIREARNEHGMNQSQFANYLGVGQNEISNFEAGKKKFVSPWYIDFLIENHYDLNSFFNEKMALKKLNEVSLAEPSQVYKLRTDTTVEKQLIPLYRLEASAGLVELFNNKNDLSPVDHLMIPNLPKTDGALRVVGDSMYPLLKSGDIIVYKEHSNNLEDIFFGEMYLISIKIDHDELVLVKWIQKSDIDNDHIRLVSENRHHQPKDIHISKVQAMALIKASVRINSM